MRDRYAVVRSLSLRDHILMDIVGKDGRELARARSHGKWKQRSVSRARTGVAAGTESRTVTDKEIASMTTRTRGVAGELRDIRESAGGNPVGGRDFMTRSAV